MHTRIGKCRPPSNNSSKASVRKSGWCSILQAISWAWELLTEVYKLDKDRIYVTIFEGSEDADQLSKDTEAHELWKELIAEERILLGNKKDNFWEMGEQGPCGPCSEIHIDLRSDKERQLTPGDQLVNAHLSRLGNHGLRRSVRQGERDARHGCRKDPAPRCRG